MLTQDKIVLSSLAGFRILTVILTLFLILLILTWLFSLLITSQPNPTSAAASDLSEEFQSALDAFQKQYGFPGAGAGIYRTGPFGPVYGHGGWIPGYSSSLRYYPDHGIAIAFQINTDIGIVDDTTPVMREIEARLAEIVTSAIGIGTAIADRPSPTTKHTDHVLRRFGWGHRSGLHQCETSRLFYSPGSFHWLLCPSGFALRAMP